MYAHHLPMQLVRAIAPSRFAAGIAVTLALLSAACSESASRIGTPALFDKAGSGAALAAPTSAASNFTVLANAAVTCSETGSITGDVGTFLASPSGVVTQGDCAIAGTVHVGDAAAQQAYDNFLNTYAGLAPKLGECTTANTLTGTLAGVTLPPGTYCVSAEAKTGALTLTGSGPWTFKVLGALTGTNFSVLMADATKSCNVTWWVGAAATMTTSAFVGNILAGAAITMSQGTFSGNAWAGAAGVGDVTVTGTVVTGCAGGTGNGNGNGKGSKCNQGVGNGPELCDPGNSNNHNATNDESGGTPGKPGRKP